MQRITAFFGLLLFPICLKSQTASFTYKSINNSYCSPDTIQFTPVSTGSPIGYLWDFGNNRTSHSSHPSVIYNNGGTYTIKLIVIYAQGTEEVSNDVVINPTINPSFSYDKNSLCKPGTINFSATGIGNVQNYHWHFDDGTADSDTPAKDINHSFANYGDFNVTLTVTSASGCISSSNTNITIQKPQITANISATQGCIPATVNFDATVSVLPGDGVKSYLWKFGDGSQLTTPGNNTSHNYSTTGKFSPSLQITTNAGCMNSFTFDSVGFGIPPTNLIAYAKQNVICGSETAVFIGKATNALSYSWDNGESIDEVTDTISNHKYLTLGNKKIIVTPSFNGCLGNSNSFNINVIGVIAKFDLRNFCNDKKTFNFTNRSLGNQSSVIWDFGDGSPQVNSFHARHTFADTGSYIVTLTIHDNVTGCSDSLKQLISIANPILINPDQFVCRNSNTTFTVLNVYPGLPSKYVYHALGKITGLGPRVFTIKADQFGTFSSANNWVLINNGASYCYDTIYLNHAIVVKGPMVNFTSKDTICLGTLLDFTNNSKPYIPGETIVSWDWNFGDGSIHDSTAQPQPHEYSNPGRYNVRLTATDINGCTDVFTKTVAVGDNGFVYVLPKSDTLCSGQSKMLIAYQNDSLMWSPAGFVSCPTCDTVMVNPTRTTMFYATSTNSFGCSATDSALVKVYLPFIATTPVADLYICPNESVQLDVTPPFYEIMWNPPTGLSDPNIYSPVASPAVSTTYTATLSDSVGCFSSSVDINVHLKSPPTVDAGPDKFYPFYSSFTISPVYSSNVVSYLWSPAKDLNCTTCANPSGIITETQTYTIAVTSDSGCVAKDQITIYVECKDADLLLPTAFTPNDDNINDVFYPLTRGIKTILNFSIYNRQGQLVFHNKNFPPNNKSYGWDGRVKGEPNSTAVFVYIIEALCDTNERIAKKGSFVLIK